MPEKKRDVDLFAPSVPPERWHPNYRRTVESASEEERQVLRDWSRSFIDRDGKFVQEFQTTFNSSFWELYLFALFRETGCQVDMGFERPDFVVTGGPLGAFTAEAVIASNARDGLPEWAVNFSDGPPPAEGLIELASLRLAQAVTEKMGKWRRDYLHLAQCEHRPFIVCVAPFEQPWAYSQGTQAIDRVLFGGPRPLVARRRDGASRVVGRETTGAAVKPSGAAVPLGLFTVAANADVSAVLFSSLATWSKVRALARPGNALVLIHAIRWREVGGLENVVANAGEFVETLADGTHLFVNPYAACPIDVEPWRTAGIGIHSFHEDGTASDVPNGVLVQRRAWEIRTVGEDRPATMPHKRPAGAVDQSHLPPPDGVLFGGPGEVDLTDSIQLVLHRGWTIYVGRDVVDGDWCAMAKRSVLLSIQAFLDDRARENWIGTFVETRELALGQAKTHVDEIVGTAAR